MKYILCFFTSFFLIINTVCSENNNATKEHFASIFLGYNFYTPKLKSIRNKVKNAGHGVIDNKTSMYFSLHGLEIKDDDYTGALVGYCKYTGRSKYFSILIHNIVLNGIMCARSPDDKIAFYLSGGVNLFIMERYGIPGYRDDVEYVDYPYGFNCLFGLAYKIIEPLYAGYEIGYTWSKTSTLGGTLYDLSDTINCFYLGLLFL